MRRIPAQPQRAVCPISLGNFPAPLASNPCSLLSWPPFLTGSYQSSGLGLKETPRPLLARDRYHCTSEEMEMCTEPAMEIRKDDCKLINRETRMHTSPINSHHLKARAIWGGEREEGRPPNAANHEVSDPSFSAAANKLFLLCRGTNECAAVALNLLYGPCLPWPSQPGMGARARLHWPRSPAGRLLANGRRCTGASCLHVSRARQRGGPSIGSPRSYADSKGHT